MPRFHCPVPLASGQVLALPAGAARHVQVLRLQPGLPVTLFDGEGGEFDAVIDHMGRADVRVRVGARHDIEREAPRAVHLVIGTPANERMDWLVEKATELGVASIQPVLAERSVLKLSGERAERKRAHWQGIAIAACEQSGRNRVPTVAEPLPLHEWLHAGLREALHTPARGAAADPAARRLLLSLSPAAQPLARCVDNAGPVTLLSGPEGGLSAAEEQAAMDAGFVAVNLGPRTLRAETAPLAALAALTLAR